MNCVDEIKRKLKYTNEIKKKVIGKLSGTDQNETSFVSFSDRVINIMSLQLLLSLSFRLSWFLNMLVSNPKN